MHYISVVLLILSVIVSCFVSNGKVTWSCEGSGAHLGRMTLDPGVTAFCLAASRPFETARDASIKDGDRDTSTLDPFIPLEDGIQLMTVLTLSKCLNSSYNTESLSH